jgi:8-oxo-dGTP pyrophosphatase MutT (NUDIX family)
MLYSYGLIVYREINGNIEYLIVRPSSKGRYNNSPFYFPKGGKQGNETFEETACRETFEETGVEAEIVSDLIFVKYFSGRKTIGLYVAKYKDGQVDSKGNCLKHDEENDIVKFFPYEKAARMLRVEFRDVLKNVHKELRIKS